MVKQISVKKILKKIAKLHLSFAGGFFVLYLFASLIYSPEFLLSDMRSKFQAVADDTIALVATVLAPPVKPVVTGEAVCNNGNLSVNLDWLSDQNSESFDVERDSLPLVTGLLSSQYTDSVVTVGTTYAYVVTARGSMGPGFAVSDMVNVTTPNECEVTLPDPEIQVTTFDGKNAGSYVGTPITTNRQPIFTGTTNIANANIYILISSGAVISANLNANAGGFWTWTPPVSLPLGTISMFVSATDPTDALRTIFTNFTFSIKKKTTSGGDDEKEKKKAMAVVPSKPIKPTGQTPTGAVEIPLDFSLAASPPAVFQGNELTTLIRINKLEARHEGAAAIVRYRIFDEKGEQQENILADTTLNLGGLISRNLAIPKYFGDGRYRVQAEILLDNYTVSREKYFSVLPLPVFNLGGGFLVTYPELLSRIGTVALWLLLLLILWLLFFSREYWLYLHSLRHITERNLIKLGLFGERRGKGVPR